MEVTFQTAEGSAADGARPHPHDRVTNQNPSSATTSNTKTNDPERPEWSGRRFKGKLKYWYKECSGNGAGSEKVGESEFDVKTGGYVYFKRYDHNDPDGKYKKGDYEKDEDGNYVPDSPLNPGSDTGWPAGDDYFISFDCEGSIPGFSVCNANNGDKAMIGNRTAMKIHSEQREDGSSGCIVITRIGAKTRNPNDEAWKDFKELMSKGCPGERKKCPVVRTVPLKVVYAAGGAQPQYDPPQ